MNTTDIKFKTIQMINGVKYLSKEQLWGLKHNVCHCLQIEKSEENFKEVEKAVEIYFNTQNSINIY